MGDPARAPSHRRTVHPTVVFRLISRPPHTYTDTHTKKTKKTIKKNLSLFSLSLSPRSGPLRGDEQGTSLFDLSLSPARRFPGYGGVG